MPIPKLHAALLRKLVLLLSIVSLCSLGLACRTVYPQLSSKDPRINQNMNDYYAADAIATVQGNCFEAKMLQCVKLKTHGYTFYHYRVVIAPRTEMPLQSLNIFFLPPKALSKYFLVDHPWASNEMMKGSVPDLEAYGAMNSVDKLWPIEYRFTWTNYGDEAQQAAGITNDAFDEQMRTLRIEVNYNGRTESLSLSTGLPFIEVSSLGDPLVKDSWFLQAILKDGTPYAQRNPYRAGQ
jgi:hypothetical protein